MNNFPETLLALASALKDTDAANGRLDEAIGYLDADGEMTVDAWAPWQDAILTCNQFGITISVFDLFDAPVHNVSVPSHVKVRISKPNSASSFHAFTIEGLSLLLHDPEVQRSARIILIAQEFGPFDTIACRFDRWKHGTEDDVSSLPADGEPRRFIYDATLGAVPQRTAHLLLRDGFPSPSPTFEAWRLITAQYLPRLLVNEIFPGDNDRSFTFRVGRRVSIDFTFPAIVDAALFEIESDVARWIYFEGPGIENRHTFFTAELGRLWPDPKQWAPTFAVTGRKALDGARSANQLLLSGKTSDVLKTLSDLRKNMTDDVGRVTQQIRDLGSALWRDFIIAASALSARAAFSTNETIGLRSIPVLAAVFIVYSVWVTLTGNEKTLQIAHSIRKGWSTRVYSFIESDDLKNLFENPLDETEKLYKRNRNHTIVAYAVLTIVLALAAVWQTSWSTALEGEAHLLRSEATSLLSGPVVQQRVQPGRTSQGAASRAAAPNDGNATAHP